METTSENFNNTDITSYGEIEKFMYYGKDAYSFFNREIQKCMPFFQFPKEISKSTGTPNFGYSWSVFIDNSVADYMTKAWLEIELPKVVLKNTNVYGESGRIRWTENIGHNLISECTLSFNDIILTKLDNFILDCISEFDYDENKYSGYMKAIGNVQKLITPQKVLEAHKITIPLPMFFCKDTGNAIPLSALINTEIKISVNFRDWENLLILENENIIEPVLVVPNLEKDIEIVPKLNGAKAYGMFVNVSEEERKRIGVNPKTMIIEQIQTCPRQMIGKEKTIHSNLMFKQSVIKLYFAAKNTTFKNCWSNYSLSHKKSINGVMIQEDADVDLIDTVCIKYGEKDRVPEMPASFFNYIQPMYFSNKIPNRKGLYEYSFAIDNNIVDPCGSVNICRIDNPSLVVKFNEALINSKDTFEFIVMAVSQNIIRVSEGKITFPAF